MTNSKIFHSINFSRKSTQLKIVIIMAFLLLCLMPVGVSAKAPSKSECSNLKIQSVLKTLSSSVRKSAKSKYKKLKCDKVLKVKKRKKNNNKTAGSSSPVGACIAWKKSKGSSTKSAKKWCKSKRSAADKKFKFVCSSNKKSPFTAAQNTAPYTGNLGCSVPKNIQKNKSVRGYVRLFTPACKIHDLCYRSPWQKAGYKSYRGKQYCDSEFRNIMYKICKKRFPKTPNVGGIIGSLSKKAVKKYANPCTKAADAFYFGVSDALAVMPKILQKAGLKKAKLKNDGRKAFNTGQKKHAKYCRIVR